ncbi:OA1 [Mytilus coruscus]|uniref:OA1 n=1 Tax=Mytilus coruscus TaxID=42192 RepID=A0A6J8AZD3_MYTCO|nr:OA1 [Mytilus coruscus]
MITSQNLPINFQAVVHSLISVSVPYCDTRFNVISEGKQDPKRALIWHYGRYTASERKLIDSIHFKFILILAAFLTSWLPNIIDAVIHMAQNDNKTAKLTIWIIMCVLNPLQPVLCALVLWGLPESRISFSSWWNNTSTDLSDISSSNVNFSRSTSSETEPLISFRRKERK